MYSGMFVLAIMQASTYQWSPRSQSLYLDTLSDPGNIRPISVSTLFALIFEHLIEKRLNLDIHQNQFGFRKLTSTKHAYFVLNETLIYYQKGGSHCKVISLDASQAFDKLWRDGIFFKLIG